MISEELHSQSETVQTNRQNKDQKIQLEAQWAEPVSLTCHSVLRKLYIEPSIGASYQISINLAKWFRRRFFLIGQSQTRTAYGSHISCIISTNMKIFHYSYKVKIHCAS